MLRKQGIRRHSARRRRGRAVLAWSASPGNAQAVRAAAAGACAARVACVVAVAAARESTITAISTLLLLGFVLRQFLDTLQDEDGEEDQDHPLGDAIGQLRKNFKKKKKKKKTQTVTTHTSAKNLKTQ